MKAIMFPGQGSQYRGMGKDLFKIYSNETKKASDILGYDIEELCVKDPQRQLGKTAFTQPALYVVNAFSYYNQYNNSKPDYLIGHSLGEYNALLAAGAFDFETGLKLVKKRGELMGAASGGGMAAVLGINIEELKQKLEEGRYTDIDIVNYNTPTQLVIAGQDAAINRVIKDFDSQGIKIIPLFVTAPFHSRYMKPAAEEFGIFIKNFNFSALQIPVIANATARPYGHNQIAELLSTQIASSVQWTDTIRLLMGKGVAEYVEISGEILSKMANEIKDTCLPIVEENTMGTNVSNTIIEQKIIVNKNLSFEKLEDKHKDALATRLGNKAFRDDYGIKYAYVTGAMYRGIASKEMIVAIGKAKMLGFLGTAAMSLQEVEDNIRYIQKELTNGEAYGMNLLNDISDSAFEMKTVGLYLKYGIRNVEASAYMQMSEPLVYYRLKGLRKDNNGNTVCDNKIIAKVSRPEVAEAFLRPAPEKLVNKLLNEGLITDEQASLSKNVPMSYDICVEADSGGHTDGGIAMVLLPSIQRLKDDMEKEYNYIKPIRVGLAGGIGTPQAIACAFMMKADFVLTGSINQCTVEAGISDTVKDLLQDLNVQDTDYAPAGDMFEIGAKVQVLKKGVLFPVRANKLYTLYNQYNSLDEIPVKTIEQLEKNYFKKSLAEIWEETKSYKVKTGSQTEIIKAEQNPKNKMAMIFRWYFAYSTRLAFDGDINDKVNFQVHTGPALGAFNQWVKGTELENWRNRHVGKIGIKMMEEAAKLFQATVVEIMDN